jgi:hypothetical protein
MTLRWGCAILRGLGVHDTRRSGEERSENQGDAKRGHDRDRKSDPRIGQES